MYANDLTHDLLRGADAIGAYLNLSRRKVYYLAERGELPIFRLGSILCARKSAIVEAISTRERALRDPGNEVEK